MNLRACQIVFLSLFAFASTSWAELKWIPQKDRVKAKMVGDFKTFDGKKAPLKKLKSKVIFLNFWATWCSPCKEEMPWMTELSNKFSPQGLQLIAVTNEDPDIVRGFLKGKDFSFPIVLDSGDTLMNRFKVETVPTTVVIDSEGRVAFRVNSAFKWNSSEVITALEDLLNEGN
jgi:thiol-disulfide isomerase/thioredoxin